MWWLSFNSKIKLQNVLGSVSHMPTQTISAKTNLMSPKFRSSQYHNQYNQYHMAAKQTENIKQLIALNSN